MDVCDSKYLGIDGLYTMCRNLQLTTKRSEKERIIEHNKEYEDFKELLLFLFDNSVTTGLDIKKINKELPLGFLQEYENTSSASFARLLPAFEAAVRSLKSLDTPESPAIPHFLFK